MRRRLIFLCGLVFLNACGGGGGGDSGCSGDCAVAGYQLTVDDVKQVLAQGIHQADAMGAQATLAVVDRVGNVLAVYRMAPGGIAVEISTTFPTSITGGLEGVVLPPDGTIMTTSGPALVTNADTLAAIAKAVTGAYLSSEGNAFSTRTANQIVQEHFNPGEQDQPSGPLFGVQFSQLACSDFIQASPAPGTGVGPQRSPLGLSADPGGFPLYKGGTVVGGVGVIADGRYSIDKNILDVDRNLDEMIALAATYGFDAPESRRADRITLDGKTARFSDVDFGDLAVSPDQAPDFDSLQGPGALVDVTGYGGGNIVNGTVFGRAASGIRPAEGYPGLEAFTFVNQDNVERFPPTGGADQAALATAPLSADEVRALLSAALGVANRARAQIRTPLGTPARVTVSVVDSQGNILGMLRSRDAPVFGADVSLQKARTAALFSSRDAADFLNGIEKPAIYLNSQLKPSGERIRIDSYVDAVQQFVGSSALSDGTAFSDRAGGNLSRPFYPDGIDGNTHGPFSKSFAAGKWSVFSTGLQLDLAYNQIIGHIAHVIGLAATDVAPNCAQSSVPRVANGIQIFPGSVPIYRGDQLVGGIGVSGDGVDQDDMIAFLGLHEAAAALNGSINNAPSGMRSDRLQPAGERLRYVQCPQTPYIDSNEQNVCSGK
jgi:uncharacterized protein GlcG (DUF336 family)